MEKDEPKVERSPEAKADEVSSDSDSLVGAKIADRYSILARVAKGGTAVVYRALDTVLNREVAVKILHEHLENKAEVVERFRKEAVLIAQLRHPNILNVYDFLEYRGRAVLVVEFMPGITLSALVNQTAKIPEDIVLMITLEILQGLKAAHQKGITHRDIKPANVLVHSDLGIKISDFGLAKLAEGDEGLTKTGIFVGTPSFSSPEQIEGREVDQRSDLFSLGLTMYMLATRSHAFKTKGDSTTTVWFKTVRGTFQSARSRNPSLSEDFEKIVNKALEVSVEKRYPTAESMIVDLETLLKSRKLSQYQGRLKKFLESPNDFSGLPDRGAGAKRRSLRTMLAMLFLSLVAAGVMLYFHFEVPYSSEEAVVIPPPPPLITPEIVVPSPSPSPLVESPTLTEASVGKKAAVVKGKSARESKVKSPSSSDRGGIWIRDKALIVSNSGALLPLFRVKWSGNSHFVSALDSAFTRTVDQGEAPEKSWALKNLQPGILFWKGGATSGQVEIQSLETYRARYQASKRPLVVSAQFADVDVEMNPWSQQLRLTWQSSPDAQAYRLELSKDPDFAQLLFSSVLSTKAATIERFWESSTVIYWRLSYLDENRSVFLIDPVRKINLTIKGGPSYLDLLSPRSSADLNVGTIEIKALAPSQVGWACAAVGDLETPRHFEPLKYEAPYFVGRVSKTNEMKWLVCEAKTEALSTYFVISSAQ